MNKDNYVSFKDNYIIGAEDVDDYISVEDVLKSVPHATEKEKGLIKRAAEYAKEKHNGQKRNSGVQYYTHPFSVAKILGELGVNVNVVCAGLLHDVIEDCDVTKEDIEKEFNDTIAFYVDGVSNVSDTPYRGWDKKVMEVKRLLIETSKDLRVIVIKLADRLHNTETLHSVQSEEKRRKKSKETQKIYAPIAGRLGMVGLKAHLEEKAFTELHPEEYTKLKKEIDKKMADDSIQSIEKKISSHLKDKGQDVYITSRRKTVYSTYMKMKEQKKELDEIYDLNTLHIVVEDTNSAYVVLGIIHKNWRSIPNSFKNYISFPKPNGYQGIHTKLIVDNQIIEVQILTNKMYHYSNFGKAAYFNYKDKRHEIQSIDPKWFDSLLVSREGWLEHISSMYEGDNADILFSNIESNFLCKRMFVFTPTGEVVDLPKGAIVLDFAFSVDSDMGSRAEGAFINDKYASLYTELKNGDVVQMRTEKSIKVNEKWLESVKTSKARTYIKKIIKRNS